MDQLYSNTFVELTTQTPTQAAMECTGSASNVVVSSTPNADPGFPADITQNGILVAHFGPLLAGGTNPPLRSIYPDPGGDGIIVNVCGVAGVEQSQTMYLVFGDHVPNIQLRGPGTITATLIFDSPQVSAINPSTGWSVALNFKKGNATDGGAVHDSAIGPTCHFTKDGNVKLNFVDARCKINQPDVVDSYDIFQNEGTTFTLSASLTIPPQDNVYGTATLNYAVKKKVLDYEIWLPILMGPCNLTTPANFSIDSITAIGIAVVNPVDTVDETKKSYDRVSARLRSFTLSATPWFFTGKPDIHVPPAGGEPPLWKNRPYS